MKQMLEYLTNTFRLFALFIVLLTCANAQASWRVINMQESGTLSSQFEWKEDWYLDSLTVTGVINSSDLKFIREHSYVYSLNYVDLSKATIEEGYIPDNAFQASQRLTTLLLPETSVDSIGVSAFQGCGIKSLVIPNTVKAIAKNAFYGCSIKSITIPESVKSIGQGAFMSSELTSVVLPNSITTIAEGTFHGCDSLKTIVFPNGLTAIGEKCFMGCKSLKHISIPETVTTIGEYAFDGSGLECVEIPNSVTSIGKSVFRSCPNLRRVTLHENMKTIAKGMFADCTSLKSVVIPSSVTEIENLAFDGCTSLKSIVIPNSVTKIETNAFAYCTAMHTFCFPASVNSVDGFYQSGVKTFYVLGGDLDLESSVALGTADSTLAIYVLESYYKKYKKEESSWYGDNWYVYYDNVKVLSTPINIISCDEMQLEIGDVFQLAAFNVYEHPITWSSSDVSIAEVTQEGLVTVKGSGIVTITALSDIADPVTCVINVVKKQQSITWNQRFNVAHIGDEISLNAVASSGLSVEYAITQGSDYAEIKDGNLICKAAGDITIEARQTGNDEYEAAESVSKTVSIGKNQQSITWEQSFEGVNVGDEIALSATTSSGLPVEYVITQGEEYAEITDSTLVCKAVGEVTIEARQSGNEDYDAAESVSTTVTIEEPVVVAQSIALDKTNIEIYTSRTETLSVIFTPENTTDKTVEWTSENPSTAKVFSDGTVFGVSVGTTTVTATTTNGLTTTCTVVVNPLRSQSISWEQQFADVHVGDEIELTATASSGLDVEYVITQGTEYAEIKDGKLVCKAAGEVTIEARQEGLDPYVAAETVSKTITISVVTRTIPITIDGLTYDYCDGNENNLQVIGCTAEVANVLAEINGIPVTTLNQTFRSNKIVKEIYLPSSIVNLGFIPFEKNYNLTKITVDENNTALCDIDGVLFSKDKSTLLYYPAGKETTYSVPIGTTIISDHAFSGNEQLTSIELPEGLLSIADDAFQSCIGLTSFTFPSTITLLSYGVIRECNGITEIHSGILSPASVSLGGNVFENIDKETCTLYVPIGTKALYEAADQWKDFKNIVEESATGMVHISMNDITLVVHGNVVEIINAPNGCQVQIHSMTGQLVYAGNKAIVEIPDCGMYIITACGQSKKIIIK